MHVDQPGRKDAPVVAEGAGVSFVMPVLNEQAYLRRAVETVLAQDVAAPTELILALAPSTDGTTELARELAADERIVLVDNVGSSRVDLQACKLEYSIVSPK